MERDVNTQHRCIQNFIKHLRCLSILSTAINQRTAKMLQSKETTVQSYWKMSNENTKKSPGIECASFNCMEEIEMNNFAVWIAHSLLFCFYFVMNLRKNIYIAYIRLLLKLSLPHTSQYAFSLTTRSSSERTYFMNDPLLISLIIKILYIELFVAILTL